jgi:hypothetical protein
LPRESIFKVVFGFSLSVLSGLNWLFGWIRAFDWLQKNSPSLWGILESPATQILLILLGVLLSGAGLWEILQFKRRPAADILPSDPRSVAEAKGDHNRVGAIAGITGDANQYFGDVHYYPSTAKGAPIGDPRHRTLEGWQRVSILNDMSFFKGAEISIMAHNDTEPMNYARQFCDILAECGFLVDGPRPIPLTATFWDIQVSRDSFLEERPIVQAVLNMLSRLNVRYRPSPILDGSIPKGKMALLVGVNGPEWNSWNNHPPLGIEPDWIKPSPRAQESLYSKIVREQEGQ